jgi:hypothetical protein
MKGAGSGAGGPVVASGVAAEPSQPAAVGVSCFEHALEHA